MQIRHFSWLFAAVASTGMAASVHADGPLTGKWKVTVLSAANELPVWLLKIDEKDGKYSASVLSSGLENFDTARVESIQVKDNRLHARMLLNGFVLYLSAYAPKDAKQPEKLLGSLLVPGGGEPIRLERTDLPKLDPKQKPKEGPGAKEWDELMKTELLKDKVTILKHLVKKYADDPVALQGNLNLLNYTVADLSPADIKKVAQTVLALARKYGPELEGSTSRDLAGILLNREKNKGLALSYAEKARELLGKHVPATDRQFTLKVLASALREAGKGEQAKEVEQELAKLGPDLDAEFKLVAIPFSIEPYKGRKADSKRVSVVELFTGAQCPPCVSADAAFDALLKTYKPADVVFLQYHLNIPGPDPLANASSEARLDYYVKKEEHQTPLVFVNGAKGPAVGGPKAFAKKRYDRLREDLDKALEESEAAHVSLTAKRDESKIDLTAKLAKLPKKSKTLRLHFLIVEDVVRYPGLNGQRFHHHVVRGFAGSPAGVAVKAGEHTYEQSLDLKKLKLRLIDYMEQSNKTDPYPDNERPLELQYLKAVVLLQNDETKEILNAAQVTIPAK